MEKRYPVNRCSSIFLLQRGNYKFMIFFCLFTLSFSAPRAQCLNWFGHSAYRGGQSCTDRAVIIDLVGFSVCL